MNLFIFPHVPKFCELENRSIIIIQFEEERKRWKNPLRLRNLWDDTKMSNVCTVGLPEGVERMGWEKTI